MRKTFEQKFNERFTKSDDCWEWIGSKRIDGYGQISKNGHTVMAHRFSYEYFIGEIHNNMFVLHKCDNPSCVRPDHLFLGTNADNMVDMYKKGRGQYLKGESNGRSKLTEEQVMYIRSDNSNYNDIAKKFNITSSNVSAIKLRKSWKHI